MANSDLLKECVSRGEAVAAVRGLFEQVFIDRLLALGFTLDDIDDDIVQQALASFDEAADAFRRFLDEEGVGPA